MSKNFELLTQPGIQFDLFKAQPKVVDRPRPVAASVVATPAHTGTSQGALSAEELALVQRVFFEPGPEAPSTVVFCGIDAGDEVSSLCTRVGETLASCGAGDVCVIDADLRTPSLHRKYGSENRMGFADAILESGDGRSYAHQIGSGTLWLMSAGSRTAELPAVLSPGRLGVGLAELRRQFGNVVISAPPVNLYPDAILLGQFADGVVLVLKSNSTRRVTALKVKESLAASNVRLLGAILTGRVFPIPEALYQRL